MADAASSSAPPEEAKTFLDEVTGEQVSKGELKRRQKAREKAAKKAAATQTSNASSTAAAPSIDHAKSNYGDITTATILDGPNVKLSAIGEEDVGKPFRLRANIQNSRMQGAKMVFLELRKGYNWTIQAIVAADAEGKQVSKQMVKWTGGINLESLVDVQGTVQKPKESVKSTRVSEYELHIQKIYLVSAAPQNLGLTFAAASRAVGKLDDEEAGASEALEGMSYLHIHW
jgi:hypothetical protein